MSAITETGPGGEMVCIVAFSARPRDRGQRPIPGPRRQFRVGEHVRFVSAFFKDTPDDNPTGWMAVFEPLGEESDVPYAATQAYFVSLDCWAGLEKHFRGSATPKNGRRVKTKSRRPGTSVSPRVHP